MIEALRREQKATIAALSILMLIILVADGLLMYHTLVQKNQNKFDFYPRWVGVRAMLFERIDPYSDLVTQRTQIGMRGRLSLPWEGQHPFLYPAFIAFTIPHFLLPFPWAVTTWIVTLQVCLLLTVLLVAQGRQPGPLFLALLILAAALNPLNVTVVVLGQFTLYVLFFLALAYWLWKRDHYLLAGCALTQVTVKPHLTFLIVICWLLLALKERKWEFVTAFGATMAVLAALPAFFVGNWLAGFLGGSAGYDTSAFNLLLPEPVAMVLQGALIAILWPLCLVLWLRPDWAQRVRLFDIAEEWRLGYVMSFTLVVVALTTPRVRNYDLALTTFVVVYGLLYLRNRSGRVAKMASLALWGTALAGPWITVWLSRLLESEQLETLLLSAVLLAVLLVLPLAKKRGSSPAAGF